MAERSSFFDLRSIPEAAIESIEVLKDGASTTYGADAVAGVVNIKLRHDYKGVQAQVGYGNTLDKDSGEVRANMVFGIGDGNTNVTGVIDYYHRNSIFNRDRGYSAAADLLEHQLNAGKSVVDLRFRLSRLAERRLRASSRYCRAGNSPGIRRIRRASSSVTRPSVPMG